jgi:hypothetical protein
VRVSVLSGAGPPASGLDVAVRFDRNPLVRLSACGPGCYQSEVASVGLRRHVAVQIGALSYPLVLPAVHALPDGTAIVQRAAKVWRALKSLVWRERLASDPTDALHTTYEAVAPDELSYTIAGSSSAVIIGNARWDRSTPRGRWVRSEQNPPLRQPTPQWVQVTDARVLGSGRVHEDAVWIVSFFDPVTPAWFEAKIGKATGRTLELTMTAVAHFMHHEYGPFDAPIRLHPPAA